MRVKWDVLFWFTFTKLDTFVQYLIIVQYFFYAILLQKKIKYFYITCTVSQNTPDPLDILDIIDLVGNIDID